MARNYLAYIVLIIVIVALVGVGAYYFYGKSTTTSVTKPALPSSYAVQITDPMTAPPGTQAVHVSYSDVKIHQRATNAYVNAQGNGTLNLTALQNGATETMAIIPNATNQSFNGATFLITSAKITINDTNYTLQLPVSKVTANLSSNSSGFGGILIDLSSTIFQLYSKPTNNEYALILSPAALNVTAQDLNSSGAEHLYANASLSTQQISQLNTSSNFSITSASASVSGNSTMLNISVNNTGSSAITVKDVLISGYARDISNNVNQLANTNASSNSSANLSIGAIIGPVLLNSTVLSDMNVTANLTAQDVSYLAQAQLFSNDYQNSINFVVDSNGRLHLPQSASNLTASGYVIQPGQYAKLRFDGSIMLQYASGIAVLIPNQTYSVEVIDSSGVSSTSQFNATTS